MYIYIYMFFISNTFINNINLKLTKNSAKAQQSFIHIFITFLVFIEEKIIASSKKICKNKRVCFNKMIWLIIIQMKLTTKNRSHRKTKITYKDTNILKISFLVRLCLYVLSNPQVYLRLILLKSEASLRLSRQSALLIRKDV